MHLLDMFIQHSCTFANLEKMQKRHSTPIFFLLCSIEEDIEDRNYQNIDLFKKEKR